MEFKIDIKNIESGRVVTNNDGKKIEYVIKDYVIVEVNPYNEDKLAEEKINNLLKNDENVKKINAIIKMCEKKELDKIAAKNRDEIAKNLQSELVAEEYDHDITVCDNSIEKLKKLIFETTLKEDTENEKTKEKIFNLIEDYKQYVNKKNKLMNLEWEKTK